MVGERILRKVRVEGGYLNFSSAHFIIHSEKCEQLHGHNYSVLVEIEGELGEDQVVFDFVVLKRLTRELCQQLNNRFLLPLRNAHLELISTPETWEIRFQEKRYVFPRMDVVELPIENSSAELLAEYICDQLCAKLLTHNRHNLQNIIVGVGEAPTQIAYYQRIFLL